MKRIYLSAAIPFLLGAAPGMDIETKNDLRCLIAVSSLAQSDDKTVAMAGLIGAQYFLGRIDGRVPTLDLERALGDEVSTLRNLEVPALLQSCGKQIEQRGRSLKEIGERIEKKETHSSSSSS